MLFPPLRNLDVTPIEQDGETLICLTDPEGYVNSQAALSGAAFFVAACLDGTTSAADIKAAFAKQFGASISDDNINKVVNFLDNAGYLYSERFFTLRDAARREFANLQTRPAWLAGKSYPEDRVELAQFLTDMLSASGQSQDALCNGPVRLLIAPHIDFKRGGLAYAAAYGRVNWLETRPSLVFIFGVAHAGAEEPFVLTRKDFDTPLGTVKTDLGVVERLAEACRWDAFNSEIAHRTEHSIEFQVVMLAHQLGGRLDGVRIVPVLCGPLAMDGSALEVPPEDPASVAGIVDFLAACREEASGEAVLVVAGADLAHVGKRFGDGFDVDERVLRAVEVRDREDLERALAGDALGFYRSVMKDGNARKVCGIFSIYSALSTIDGTAEPGKLLHYGCAEDPAGGIVSFAGAAFAAKRRRATSG